MTLEEINKADAALRTKMDLAFKSKDAQLLLNALEMDILDGITRRPVIEAGESSEAAISRWHSFLAGRRDILQIIRNIGKPRGIPTIAEQRPYESAIPQHLVEARERNFQPVIQAPKTKSK